MLDVRDVLDEIAQLAAGGVFLGASAVDRAQAQKGSLFVRRQRLEGGGGTRKNRIAERTAVLDRNFKGVQQRPARRRLGVGMSVCQVRPASALPIGLPFSMMLESTRISGCPGRANCVRGLISSSPNLRANAVCCSGVSFWSRNTRTEYRL
jgi:hypothetical protein